MYKQIIIALCICIATPAIAFAPSSRATAFAPSNSLVVSQQAKLPSTLFAENPQEVDADGSNDEEKIQASLAEFKQQSQIKAFAILGAAFGAFVYLKLQYDADPSTFVGGH